MKNNNYKNILLVQTGFIGDVILSTPLISALLEIYPQSNVSLLTTPVSAALFEQDNRLKEVLSFDKRGAESGVFGIINLSRKIKDRNFDVVFSLHKSYRTSILLWLTKIPVRFGFKQAKLSWLYSKTSDRDKAEHDVIRNLSILKNVDQDPKVLVRPMEIKIDNQTIEKLKLKIPFIEGKKQIVIAPGSVWLTKRWTEEGFAKLIQKLINSNFLVLMIGSNSDQEVANTIISKLPSELIKEENFQNLVGKLNLIESAALIKNCSVVVANDSAPLHLASATKTPVVAVFCATVPEFGFGPWMTKSKIIEVKDLSCRPCGRHGGNTCPTGTHFCRTRIDIEEVYNAVLELSE